ncbi:serine/threonine-protein kinase [Lentzea sp. BCCO 10_0061]|uniref:Serine/threonine-protein kinase n=1 Tax=Lentzea sokolovensis TaxID=3095429 RepID=A0ABU4V549_9PSEU|nr:serine/threonine-protein kinase [Lentzea sp. BCCO 10_0061]MDX8146917.1 serine/threonine-protein kinase [Lentzea sp. BCCO 10_0061]
MSEVTALGPGDPRRLGPYRLLGRLGAGGMGVVYLAVWPGTDRQVAIKVINRSYAEVPKYRVRFEREVRTATLIRSPHVPRLLDAELESDEPYVVTEVVRGTSLAGLEEGLAPDRLLTVARDTAQALMDIHAHQIVHRDLKPSNVMMAGERAVVIDFGIAADLADLVRVTTTGHVVGTLPYLAPELVDPRRAAPASPASDVFSWGCLLYFAATGRAAFSSAGTTLTQPIPDLTGVPGVVRELVARTLDKRPERRPSVRSILDELATVGAEVVLCGGNGRSHTARLLAVLLDNGLAVRVSADPDSLADARVLVVVVSERPDAAVRDMRLAARQRGVTVLVVLAGGHHEPDVFLDARTGALPDATQLRALRVLAMGWDTVPVPEFFPTAPLDATAALDPAVAEIAAALAEGDLVTADLHTTAVLLAAAGCADHGWAGLDEVASIGERLLRDCARVWHEGTDGKHGFLAQRLLMTDRTGTEVADLAHLFGWGDPLGIPADYPVWVTCAGPGFFPTLRHEVPSDAWFDNWNITVSALYGRIRSEFS